VLGLLRARHGNSRGSRQRCSDQISTVGSHAQPPVMA
jgi:hypothetical protein